MSSMTTIKKIAKRIFNTSLAVSVIGVIIGVIFLWSMCFSYIRPYEYGIKQVNIGLLKKRGIQERVYNAGFHFVMPFGFEEMHKFPKNIQIFSFSTRRPNKYDGIMEKEANIQTSDGFFVKIDVSILYRIFDPLVVIKTLGVGTSYIDNGLRPKAEPILKSTLGELTTEEFYNPFLRVQKMDLANEKLNAALKSKGIAVEHVLIRYFRYSDEIQRNIEDKKLKDQLVFKNQSEAKAAAEGAELSKVIQEGEAKLKVRLEEGKAYAIKQTAEKDKYVRTKKAHADLLIRLAEAEKTRLKNKALEGSGSSNLVGLKMAENLEGVQMIVLPSDGKDGFNPLNLNRTTRFFK
jgi:regulator of protease activity HflC (stomatin/prohibitin superfamily)